MSFRFKPSAPSDAIVARLLVLDTLECVLGIHFGTNCGLENMARGHTHGFIITFKDASARDTYLSDPEYRAFIDFAATHVEETFVFDFID